MYGVQDLASQEPLTIETIFRIFSMTKPITGVDGAAGTFFFIHPTYDIAFLSMIQRLVNGPVPPVGLMVRPLTYQALLDPTK